MILLSGDGRLWTRRWKTMQCSGASRTADG